MGWRAALGDLRNRLVGDPGFRRWAKGFAPTRGVARKSARELFDLTAGFVYSQTLLACVQTDLFEFLKDGPQSLDAIARHADLPGPGAERLAEAAAAIELLERRGDGHYALGRLGAPLVAEPGLAAMIAHHRLLYEDLTDPLAVLRGQADGKLAAYWGYGREDRQAGETGSYSELMAATLPMVADEVFAAVDPRKAERLLDVGGGEGAFLIEAARRAPGLDLALFDLPGVAERAKARLAREGLADQAQVHAGSFLDDSLPAGADLISLVRIIHDHSDADVMALLRACRAALEPGGTLIVAEPMSGASGAAPMGEAYFGFYLMAMGRGRPRTAERLAGMLREAGFTSVRRHRARMPLIAGVLTAR
ncbi:MAG: methyltransferase [Oceanicaulis sp.]